MRRLAFALLFVLCVGPLHAQQAQTPDTISYTPPDSLRALDSAYRARKAMLDRWVREQHRDAHPQEDFISVYLSYGGYLQILPRDLNQFISERAGNANPSNDRNNYINVERAFMLGAQAQLGKSWGIYTEYDLTYSKLQVDSATRFDEIDFIFHSFVVGGMYVIYSSPFYRLRANGALGGVIALVDESEQIAKKNTASRSSSAAGMQINFDLLNDFRVLPNLSFTIDLLTRSINTGTLKTSDDKTIDEPFGANKNKLSIAPTAANTVYGFAAGLVYYF